MSSTSFRRRALRRIAVPLTAAAIATGVAAAMATPAAASNSYNGNLYVYGAGSPTDDLNDEGAVNESTNTVSNVTCLWQNILYVDGYLPLSGIDGSFGDQTYRATKKWQTDHGLVSDGSAGKATFKKAGEGFSWYYHYADGEYQGLRTSPDSTASRYFQVFRLYDKGTWYFKSASHRSQQYSASYNNNFC